MKDNSIPLMAHLVRRAGFGAPREELERYAARGYEATVEELLYPENAPKALDNEDIIKRYHVGRHEQLRLNSCQAQWVYRMINTKRPLEEKIALFWHGVFATGNTKLGNPKQMMTQIDMFRRHGLGRFPNLLLELSKDPAMIYWLDNKDSHRYEPNENYGRELLELFSMGVGSYTEQDVFEASRAFTGWTIYDASLHTTRMDTDSVWPYGRLDWQFQYKDQDHDDTEKTFLGHTGRFNGEDIIDIICRQEATARFLSRHLYNFFVADEVQVPAWQTVPPRDPRAIDLLVGAYFDAGYDIRSMLRVLFNSDFFKEAAFRKVKSPAELVVGAVRVAGGRESPMPDTIDIAVLVGDMGQRLLDPPSVEGWHTGAEWIDTGSLVDRINFAVQEFGDADRPGVKSIVQRIRQGGQVMGVEEMVDTCLDLVGPLAVSEETRRELLAQAEGGGDLRFGSDGETQAAVARIKGMLQLIVSTREYQLA